MSEITERAAKANRRAWDMYRQRRDRGEEHFRINTVQDIFDGKTYLHPECLRLVGDVRGKKLLDMGCGDGTELSEWARAGAIVTGLDNSPGQLEAARRNTEKLGVSARLIQSDFLRPPEELLQGEFDIVFSAWTHYWIGDLDRWMNNVYSALREGGQFIMYSGHPLSDYMSDVEDNDIFRSSYLEKGPFTLEDDTIQWLHTLGGIVTSAASSGLRIDALLELPSQEMEYTRRGIKGRPGLFLLTATK